MSPDQQIHNPANDAQKAGLAAARAWAATRTYPASDYPPERIIELKGDRTVSVVIPTKQVAAVAAGVVEQCVSLRDRGAVDQVIVVDASSDDGTVEVCDEAGATVYQEAELLPEFGDVIGKGDALWRALSVATGDIVVYVDSDTTEFGEHFICGLVGPLLDDDQLQLVKGSFRRPFAEGGMRLADGGGRVTELAARPLLNLFVPQLAAINQPLAGEFAARRAALIQMPYLTGYGSEIQLLVDFHRLYGLDTLAQADLGERLNRHQALPDLGAMSFAVMRAVLSRVGGLDLRLTDHSAYQGYAEGELIDRDATLVERPPFATVHTHPANAAVEH